MTRNRTISLSANIGGWLGLGYICFHYGFGAAVVAMVVALFAHIGSVTESE